MDQDGPKPDEVDVSPPVPAEAQLVGAEAATEDPPEYQLAKEMSDLTDAQLVGSLIDQLDGALDTFDIHVEQNDVMSDEERDQMRAQLKDLRIELSADPSALKRAQIKIEHKTMRPEHDAVRVYNGEDIGVKVTIDLAPPHDKTLVFNIWGSQIDYEASLNFSQDRRRVDRILDVPRTINFHTYKKSPGSHGMDRNRRLMHNARYTIHRSGHPGNLMEVIGFDGVPLPKLDRPVFATHSAVSRRMNGLLYGLTDELYARRGENDEDLYFD